MSESAFFGQIRERFQYLLDDYNFHLVNETHFAEHFGSAIVDWQSDIYVLRFTLDGRGNEVTIEVGQKDQALHDVSPIFAFLTRESGKSAQLYYFPFFTLRLSGPESSDWQLARLAGILRPLWPAIFQFVAEAGAASDEFRQYDEQTRKR
ncbi:MAG TPA: hypothetical protein VFW76_07515 [Ktedonobacterales bacterium]|nr:hypothetical protein [Ktedonobacterales bacterium]